MSSEIVSREQKECASCVRLIDEKGDPVPDSYFQGPGLKGDDPMFLCNECAGHLKRILE